MSDKDSIIANGVFIQDVNGKLWNTDDWDDSVRPNAVAVISKKCRFLIALHDVVGQEKRIADNTMEALEKMMATFQWRFHAKRDYNGKENTENLFLTIPYVANYAVGACKSWEFPNGKTEGYLPSLGQLWIAFRNRDFINAAMLKCHGDAMHNSYYWTSTFYGIYDDKSRCCWAFGWKSGFAYQALLFFNNYVRPFADF